ncbi:MULTISPECIES: cyclic nucleotide-binding domain-containing protein [Desulfosediminicola]|uniref:cyclic nucleotide-binding domain-containing protein n=1 Tax=Desulfosediminicola TaxID=2886823 RepID=UPI0010AB89AE|nr:cyclic nucleotide-binding domain-containing protein [Desulfosediminicola ganghwensis]
MGFPKVIFRIVENRSCPLYEYGDAFKLTGISIPLNKNSDNTLVTTAIVNFPKDKNICKILNGDLSKLIIQYERGDKVPICLLSCSGCTGSVKVEHSIEDAAPINGGDQQLSNEVGSLLHVLSDFEFFRYIDESNHEVVVSFFKLIKFCKNDFVIRKGDPGGNFYIIVSGSVNVLNDSGIIISKLGKGDVFGEMSLICNELVSASIQVTEDTSILHIDHHNFRKIIDRFPAIQLFFSKLMAERLKASNSIRAKDLSSGIIGNLTEIPPEALFQTLNVNNKTGILTISELTDGSAYFSFRQGSLIKAKYGKFVGDVAFYQVLKESTGRFRFTPGIPPEDFEVPEIGFFMKLLMEGMRMLDESKLKRAN